MLSNYYSYSEIDCSIGRKFLDDQMRCLGPRSGASAVAEATAGREQLRTAKRKREMWALESGLCFGVRRILQDGRPLRRHRRRWKIERTFAHLGNYRRLLIRHERLLPLYQAFFHLARLFLTLRHF